MIFLVFKIGKDRYAMEAARVVEVLPKVRLKAIPQSPPSIAGVLDYHGSPVPVVDLSAVATGTSARDSLSTRLVVIHYPTPAGEECLLGLVVEMGTETVRFQNDDFQAPGVSTPEARYLGPVASDARGMIQRVEIEHLLPAEVRGRLWQQAREAV